MFFKLEKPGQTLAVWTSFGLNDTLYWVPAIRMAFRLRLLIVEPESCCLYPEGCLGVNMDDNFWRNLLENVHLG